MTEKAEIHNTVRGRGNFTMPPECSDQVALLLSPLTAYSDVGKMQAAGRRVYAQLREMMHREAVLAHAADAERRGILKDVTNAR